MKITLGDQDFFTILGWEDSSMFHMLDCKDNMQLNLQYLASYIKEGNEEMQKKFLNYQYCAPNLEARILHFNGCGPKLKHCEINWHSLAHQRESDSYHKGLPNFVPLYLYLSLYTIYQISSKYFDNEPLLGSFSSWIYMIQVVRLQICMSIVSFSKTYLGETDLGDTYLGELWVPSK